MAIERPSTDAQQNENAAIPNVIVPESTPRIDLVTILGIFLTIGLITAAIMMGNSNASFYDLPSVLIVVLGTITATSISYTSEEFKKSFPVLGRVIYRSNRPKQKFAKSLMDLATVARKRGVLALARFDREMRKDPFLHKSMQMIIDGYSAENVHRVLHFEIEAAAEQNKRAAGILRRAAEISPAMGLIGTLIGLVQMLANLDDPQSIGPAMAVALLTTFYGIVMSSVILAPLAAKIEKYAADETASKTMVLKTVISIVRQENPRTLEMLINAELPPSERVIYFD